MGKYSYSVFGFGPGDSGSIPRFYVTWCLLPRQIWIATERAPLIKHQAYSTNLAQTSHWLNDVMRKL